jgi:phenylacetate-CoA ligase
MLSKSLLRAVGLPAIEVCTRARFWSRYRGAVRFDRSGAETQQTQTRERLAVLLNAALKTGLQRQRLERAGIPGTDVSSQTSMGILHRLQPIGKDEIRRNFPADVLTPGHEGERAYLTTSGTTADRMTVVSDFAKRDAGRAAELHSLKIALNQDVGVASVEIPPNACNAVCGVGEALPQTLGGYVWHALRRQSLLDANVRSELHGRFEKRVIHRRRTLQPLDPAPPEILRPTLDDRLDDIARERPVLLRGFPQYLLWLAERAASRQLRLPSLKAIGPYGGLASPQMAQRIRDGFRADFRNLYGTSELGPVAAACSNSPAMHVFESHFIIEVFRGNEPAGPGEIGQLVVTDLTNLTMPLIRYRVGDVGRLIAEPCDCGRRSIRLEVLGRISEVLNTPNGPLVPSVVADAILEDRGVANFRLEEFASGRFELSIVPSLDGPAPRPDDMRDRLAALHGGLRSLECRPAAYLQPEASGKYRLIVPLRSPQDIL